MSAPRSAVTSKIVTIEASIEKDAGDDRKTGEGAAREERRRAVAAAARGLRSSVRAVPATAVGPEVAPRPAQAAAAAAARRARAAERAREVEDSPRELRDKCRLLARALRNAKHLVVYTGAGISTAADIPDYRGPRGVWTRLQRGESVGRVDVSAARPTFTHMALTALWARGTLKFVVSQNCDGLHVRAGLPRRALAELHGDMFAERCAVCRRVYLRAFDTTARTARHHHATRRLCHACGAELRDTIVHFGERGRAAWPLNWAGALRHAARADVVLCLGSSLKVLRRYPGLWRMHRAPADRPSLYIVNLQWTPKDSAAALKINARCDDVMRAVARRLRLRVPRYRASRDPLAAHAEPLAPAEQHTAPRVTPHPASDGSESEDSVPLRRLAERLRRLRAVRVALAGGEATLLLRARHAPSPSPERSPRRLAAAIIARAVLLCRAELYPGLHTILAPAAECAWCLRHYGAARCLWYGPPRRTPPPARALRRGRYLCACCGEDEGGGEEGGGEGDAAPDADGGGWYGKGYRKGRRRRR